MTQGGWSSVVDGTVEVVEGGFDTESGREFAGVCVCSSRIFVSWR